MVNIIGGSSLSSAIATEKSIEPKKSVTPLVDPSGADLSASVAAYLSLPGFNPTIDPTQPATDAPQDTSKTASAVKSVAESDDEGLKLALKQFDEGLKKLVNRPESQAFQAKFGVSADGNGDNNGDLPAPDPLPGVNNDGQLDTGGKEDMAADTNKDGKVSEDERIRYQMPITYRSSEHVAALADGPSAFSLAEANRAYGVVAAKTAETA